jgi:predicted ester cyclase
MATSAKTRLTVRRVIRTLTPLVLIVASLPAAAQPPSVSQSYKPCDRALGVVEAASVEHAACTYAAFWNTGEDAMARAALAPNFEDRTLPPGRQQGIEGVLAASRTFRAAVPDLRAEVLALIVAGDHAVVRYRFNGHFTGSFGEQRGTGQPVSFLAIDVYRVADGRIAENWHLEDNLTLLRQLGVLRD